jgi:segregation and condensation protein B
MTSDHELLHDTVKNGAAGALDAGMPRDVSAESLSDDELAALVEALLLIAPAPAAIDELARAAGVGRGRIEQALSELEQGTRRGWVIQRHGDRVQLATAPRFAGYVRRFLGLEREARLSTAALETLAIIAYQQPVTRAEIEAVRGVDSSGVLATLLSRGLIEVVGRLQTAGNPLQYGTTPEFLAHFGLKSLADLPPLGQVDGRDLRSTLAQAIAGAHEDNSSNGLAAD